MLWSVCRKSVLLHIISTKRKNFYPKICLLFLSVGLPPVPNCFYVGSEVEYRETSNENPNSFWSNTQTVDGNWEANPFPKGLQNIVQLWGPRMLILNPCSIFIHAKFWVTSAKHLPIRLQDPASLASVSVDMNILRKTRI